MAAPLSTAEEARNVYRLSKDAGAPLSATDLAGRFRRSERWARQVRAEVDRGSRNGTPQRRNGNAAAAPAEAARKPSATSARKSAADVAEVPAAIRRTATAAVIVVAVTAAVISFAHQRTIALVAGEGWRAWLLPLSIDGLIIAASMAIIIRRRVGQPADPLSWLSFLAGVTASVAANVAAADPAGLDRVWVGRLVGAWPPFALLLAWEMLTRLVRAKR